MAALLAFGINFGAGSLLYLTDESKATERDTIVAAAVQGNISSNDKWSGSSLADTFSIYTRLTREAAAQGATLIVWPETVIPHTLPKYDWMVESVETLARETGATLLVGAFDEGDEGTLNSIFVVTPDSGLQEGGYSKRHLGPLWGISATGEADQRHLSAPDSAENARR